MEAFWHISKQVAAVRHKPLTKQGLPGDERVHLRLLIRISLQARVYFNSHLGLKRVQFEK